MGPDTLLVPAALQGPYRWVRGGSPEHPLVSVIIPTKNSERTIRACLESVRAQTYRNSEIVVVANFSSDSSDTMRTTKWGAMTDHLWLTKSTTLTTRCRSSARLSVFGAQLSGTSGSQRALLT